MQVASLDTGGLERVVLDLCLGLRRRGVRAVVIAVSRGGAIAEELRANDIPVHEIGESQVEYERVLNQEKVRDLFLHHSYFGLEAAANAGVRLYDVVHNYYFWHRGAGHLIRRAAELATRVIYVSSAVRDFHERVFGIPSDLGVVINNPLHQDGLIIPEKAQLRRLREKSLETVFLNVAQAFPAKAQPAMITAFARALKSHGSMRLKIAGAPIREESARAVRARIDEEGVAEAVELLGHCDRRKMSRLYAEAHAFVLPSLYEGYSVSAIEAAAYGLPLVLTRVGGAEDLICEEGYGVLLPPATPDLAAISPAEIERLGLMPENDATAALERAFIDIARNRGAWTARGLDARFNIVSLEDVIEAYLAQTEREVTPRL
jgi:glycosyltransferase involved in cell wall biosynthesis